MGSPILYLSGPIWQVARNPEIFEFNGLMMHYFLSWWENQSISFTGQTWTLTYLPNYPGKDMTFAVGEESPYYTYGYILAKANTNGGKVVFQGPWMEPYKKVQQFSSNTILDAAQFHQQYPGNNADYQRYPENSAADFQQYPAGGQFTNAGFQKYPTEVDMDEANIVEVEWNTEQEAASSV